VFTDGVNPYLRNIGSSRGSFASFGIGDWDIRCVLCDGCVLAVVFILN
jgi:hypothetical protein